MDEENGLQVRTVASNVWNKEPATLLLQLGAMGSGSQPLDVKGNGMLRNMHEQPQTYVEFTFIRARFHFSLKIE